MSKSSGKPKRNRKAEASTDQPPSLFDDMTLFDAVPTAPAEDEDDAETGLSGREGSLSAAERQAAASAHGGDGPLRELMDSNFLQFASYTICNRAIPTVEDGLKPVQRRILHSLWEKDDGRFIKVANVVGHTMQYHPHGDASIADAIVNLANKRYLIEGQGNYGNIFTGDPAAASRYIECRLTELARNELFNPKLTAFIPSYDGRNKEPVLLPCKLPLLLMLGADGIAVGLSTAILPHNFIELLEAQIAIIQKKPFQVFPDFQTGGIMDVSEYEDGNGRIKLRAVIEHRQHNKLAITALPFGQTTESLIANIEEAIKKKKVPVKQINDFTAEKVEIELTLNVGATQDQTIKALYAFTACESSLSSRPIVLYRNRPREMTVSEILKACTDQLLDLLLRELELRRKELDDLFHSKTLEQIFIEERIYKRIEEQTSYEAVQQAVLDGFKPFLKRLRREVTLEDVESLLQIKIRRISRYDIEKNRQEIEGILREEQEVAENIKGLRGYAVRYLKNLVKKYRPLYPRLTQIAESPFGQIEVRALTATELSLKIDRENGYIGTDIRNGEELFKCSSLDKIIVVWNDGRYKMMPPPDKFFVDKKGATYCQVFDRDKAFTCVYTEPHYGFTYIKRFAFGGAIQNKEYRLAPEGSKILLFEEDVPDAIYVKYKPAKSQRIHQQMFTPSDVLVKGVAAKGIQMTSKDIAKIATKKPGWWDDNETPPKGVLT
ncbi:MAG TPA: DNA topoisomerase IV subunit A [Kiritimatiellia bacterium]|nr:DNA topoisomerase IV subunit A [Kiritimatiellia bacterium]HRU70519.1 DNA topoisomerase IV subunit A [Kiritimatiellia bacterium]